MIEAQSATHAAIQKLLKEIEALPQDAQLAVHGVDLTIQLSNLEASNQQLRVQIQKGVKQLTEKDHVSAEVLIKAQEDEFLSLQLWAQALKHRIHSCIHEQWFESGRLERAYFWAMLGLLHNPICLYYWTPTYTVRGTDHKAHAQMADALKRQAPAIKKLVSWYNSICEQLKKLQSQSPRHRDKSIPKPLDVKMLFTLAEDENIWEDAGLGLDEEEHPPAWLADETTRDGIKAMHIHDRTVEDIICLKEQMKYLVMWLSEELALVRDVIARCKGKSDPCIDSPCSFVLPLLLLSGYFYKRSIFIIPTPVLAVACPCPGL